MDRRTFCAGAASLIPFAQQANAAARPAFRPQAQTVERLGRIGPDVPKFISHYLAHYQPQATLWGYEDGVVWSGILALYDATGDRAFLDYILSDVQPRVLADGAIPTFQPHPYNIDMIKAGSLLLPLYRETGDARFRKAMDVQFAPLKTFPRTKSGSYWHKARYPYQVWLDGLYMGQPFQLHYARVTGNPALFDDTLQQIRTVEARMRQADTGLYYHGWDESRQQRWAHPDTGLSPNIWGRAMGWWLCALVDCYEASEGFAPEGRAEIARILNSGLDAMLAVRSQDGLWYQVVDQGRRAGNYEETSGSLMTAYALMKAARLGVAGDDARDAGRDALQAVVSRFLTPTELNGICRVAGLGGDPYRDGSYAYYLSEKIVANDPKGTGPFFMALAEAVRPSSAGAGTV